VTSLAALVGSGLAREEVPLGPYTTYKSGGPARFFVEIPNPAALEEIASTGILGDLPILVLGRGSNLVVSDFMSRLERSPLFANVELGVAETGLIIDRDVVKFRITCQVTPDESAN